MSETNNTKYDLEFSLEQVTLDVSIDGKPYKLIEISGEVGTRFKAMVASTLTMTDGKVSSISDPGNTELWLISNCLVDDKGKHVSIAILKTWPNRVINKLVEKVREISGFDDDEDTEEKSKN